MDNEPKTRKHTKANNSRIEQTLTKDKEREQLYVQRRAIRGSGQMGGDGEDETVEQSQKQN